MIWLGWVLWHINQCRLFNVKSSLYICKVKLATRVEGNPKAPFSIATTPRCRGERYSFPGLYIDIKYIWFGWVGFYGISTSVGYLMSNPLYTYILNMYDLDGLVLWHINHCRLFNAKTSLYIYTKYIWFGFVGFYGIPSIVGYLMPI